MGIGGVDAVHFGGFEEDLAVQFGRAERCAGVGCEEGVAGSGGEDDDASFFEVTDGSAPDEGLGDGADVQSGHDTGVDADGVEFFFECDGVHDGAEHAHVVGGGLLDVAGLGELGAADDIAPADDDGDLGACLCGGFDFVGDGAEFLGGDPESAFGAECFAGEFEEDAAGIWAVGWGHAGSGWWARGMGADQILGLNTAEGGSSTSECGI